MFKKIKKTFKNIWQEAFEEAMQELSKEKQKRARVNLPANILVLLIVIHYFIIILFYKILISPDSFLESHVYFNPLVNITLQILGAFLLIFFIIKVTNIITNRKKNILSVTIQAIIFCNVFFSVMLLLIYPILKLIKQFINLTINPSDFLYFFAKNISYFLSPIFSVLLFIVSFAYLPNSIKKLQISRKASYFILLSMLITLCIFLLSDQVDFGFFSIITTLITFILTPENFILVFTEYDLDKIHIKNRTKQLFAIMRFSYIEIILALNITNYIILKFFEKLNNDSFLQIPRNFEIIFTPKIFVIITALLIIIINTGIRSKLAFTKKSKSVWFKKIN